VRSAGNIETPRTSETIMMNQAPSNNTDIARETLREIVTKTGDCIFEEAERCEALLKDHCGAQRREISAIVGALEERVPAELRSSWRSAMTPEAMRARLVKRLQENRGLATEVADWAVDAWSYALGVGLARSSDRLKSQVLYQGPQDNWVGSQILQAPVQEPVIADIKPPAPWRKAAIAAALAVVGYAAYPHIVDQIVPRTPSVEQTARSNVKPQTQTLLKKIIPEQQQTVPVRSIPAGSAFTVAIQQELDSNTAQAGQQVSGTLVASVSGVPAGAHVILQVDEVDTAGRFAGVPRITLSLRQVQSRGRYYAVQSAPVTVDGPSRTVNTVTKATLGAGIGCGVGMVLGKFGHRMGRGCAVGAPVGGATGTAVAARQQIRPAVIHPGTALVFRLTRPASVS